MKSLYITIVRWIGIFVNAAILLFTVFNICDFPQIDKSLAALIVFGLQALAILMSILFQSCVDKMVFNQSRKNVLRSLDAEETRIQMSRKQLRNGLNILTVVAVILILFLSFYLKSPLKFVVAICIISIAYMYADYLPSVKAYAEYYDSLTLKAGETANVIRGLAKIYKTEYKVTNFKYNHHHYKNIQMFNENNRSQQQDECIKCILRMKVDSICCPDIVYSLLIAFFNVFLVIPNLADQTLSLIIRKMDFNYVPIVLLTVNIIFLCINIVTLFKYQNDCFQIKEISEAYFSKNSKERFEEYKKILERDSDYKITHSRGVFVYCASLIDRGLSLDELPLNYKMLFIHRYEANKPRYIITVGLSLLALTMFLWDIGISLIPIGLILLTFIILSILYYFAGLKYLNQHRIIKKINEL